MIKPRYEQWMFQSFVQDMEEEIGKLRSEVVQLQERLKATEKEKTGLEEENRALQEQVFCLQQVLWSEFERTVPGEERRKGIY